MGTSKEIICPMPRLWNAIYDISKKEYIKKYGKWDKEEEFHKCVPLILDGWWASNDIEKQVHWERLKDWIKRYELDYILDDIELISEKLKISINDMWYYGE